MVEEITWEEIYPIWSNYLWPGRPNIKPYTPMINATELDLTIHKRAADKWMYYHGVFFGIRDNAGKIIGVNSGHQCSNILFRSRGLYVTPEHTGKGLAQALLKHTIEYARKKNLKKYAHIQEQEQSKHIQQLVIYVITPQSTNHMKKKMEQ